MHAAEEIDIRSVQRTVLFDKATRLIANHGIFFASRNSSADSGLVFRRDRNWQFWASDPSFPVDAGWRHLKWMFEGLGFWDEAVI